MVQIQGFRLAIGWTALIISLTVMNTMGLPAAAGVELGTAGTGAEQVESVTGNISNPEVEAVGDSDPGFFGVSTSLSSTLQQLGTILASLQPTLVGWGVPSPMAWAAQILVDLSFGLAIIQILRGFRA
jgi:hypothetical protein